MSGFVKPILGAAYNFNPPVDDGSQTVANQLFWQTHLDKIGDPLRDFAQATADNTETEFDFQWLNSVGTFSTNTTFTTTARGTLQRDTASTNITATLPSAATIGDCNAIAFLNSGSATLTIDTQSAETINGASTITLTSGQSVTLVSDGVNWYIPSANAGIDAGFRTGDVRQTTRDVDTGWLNMDGFTFGDVSSGADNKSAANEALFKHLYQKIAEVDAAVLEVEANWFDVDSFTNATDTINETAHGLLDGEKIVFQIGSGGVIPTGLLPRAVYFIVNKNNDDFQVSLTSGGSVVAFSDDGTATINVAKLDKTGSSSANADTDWAAKKTMVMPDARSHILIGSGAGLDPDTGALLTNRTLGDTGGIEDITLLGGNLPAHTHTLTVAEDAGSGDATITGSEALQNQNTVDTDTNKQYDLKGSSSTPDAGETGSVGAGNSFTNMPPFMVISIHIKL